MSIKVTSSILAKCQRVFGRKQDLDKLYVTSDEQVFMSENDGVGQARNLAAAGKDGEILVMTRSMCDRKVGELNTETEVKPEEPKEETKLVVLTPLLEAQQKHIDALAALEGKKAALEATKGKLAAAETEKEGFTEATHTNKRKATDTKIEASKSKIAELEAEVATAADEAAKAEAAVAALEAEEKGTDAE